MSVLDKIRSNMQFRVNSLRSLVTGTNDVSQAEPLKRRQAIIRRRRETLREAAGSITGSDADVEVSESSTTSTSTSSYSQETHSPAGSNNTRTAGTPTMSNVERGTVQRANDQGFGN